MLQDGTNSILKRKTSGVAELFDKYIELVKSVQRKFQHEYLVLCEVLSMRDNDRNRDQNECIKEFNNLSSFIQSNDLNVTIKNLPVAELLLKDPNYNNLIYDDIHMNCRIGLPFLKNLLLSALLVTSNGLPLVESQQAFFPRYQHGQYNNSWANTWYPKQTYNFRNPPIATCSYFISIKNHPTLRIKQKTYGLEPGRLLKVFKKVLNKFCSLILLLAGDVELNPGPPYVYKKTTAVFSGNSKKLKYFHVNCQSIVVKKKQIENLVGDLGNNTVYGFSETWLKEEDSQSFWELKKDLFKTFRSDRETMLKDRGGGVMVIVPKSLNPKIRKDLIHLNKNLFESLWIECNLNNNAHN